MAAVVAQLISQCQVIAGHFGSLEPQALIAEIRELVANLPQHVSRPDQLVISEVLDQMLGRFVHHAALEKQPQIANGFVALATTRSTLSCWRNQWLRIADCCAGILRRDAPATVDLVAADPRVTRMIRFINSGYADPYLGARAVARAANLSAWHATRLLKRQTGLGFLAHLHRRRIDAARDLLVDRSLSIKEISTTVGYLHHSQFSRHFRNACGVTPYAFRKTYAASA